MGNERRDQERDRAVEKNGVEPKNHTKDGTGRDHGDDKVHGSEFFGSEYMDTSNQHTGGMEGSQNSDQVDPHKEEKKGKHQPIDSK